MRRLAFILLTAGLIPACGSDTPTPTGVALARIGLTVAPNPIPQVISSAAGPTFSVRFTTTIAESAGLGVTVERVTAYLFDDANGALVGQALFDDKDLVVFVGSKRVEPNGKLDVRQEISYVATAKRAGSLTVNVRVKDDRGNIIEQALLVKAN